MTHLLGLFFVSFVMEVVVAIRSFICHMVMVVVGVHVV